MHVSIINTIEPKPQQPLVIQHNKYIHPDLPISCNLLIHNDILGISIASEYPIPSIIDIISPTIAKSDDINDNTTDIIPANTPITIAANKLASTSHQ